MGARGLGTASVRARCSGVEIVLGWHQAPPRWRALRALALTRAEREIADERGPWLEASRLLLRNGSQNGHKASGLGFRAERHPGIPRTKKRRARTPPRSNWIIGFVLERRDGSQNGQNASRLGFRAGRHWDSRKAILRWGADERLSASAEGSYRWRGQCVADSSLGQYAERPLCAPKET
jgi:hypothetical protein